MKTGQKPYVKITGLLISIVVVSIGSLFFFPSVLDFSMESARLVRVLYKIRLPEVTIAITAGAALGLAGALMQILLDNSLASPFTLGISSASSFGASVAIILGFTHGIAWLSTSLFALIFAMAAVGLLMLVSSIIQKLINSKFVKKPETLLKMASENILKYLGIQNNGFVYFDDNYNVIKTEILPI